MIKKVIEPFMPGPIGLFEYLGVDMRLTLEGFAVFTDNAHPGKYRTDLGVCIQKPQTYWIHF